jgi:rfaE bifunctional protein nucleotidyltransferase chain/domain
MVGVNGDNSVRRLKGPGRPLVQQDERAEILSALCAVDYVTIFHEATASGLVRAVRPQVYVKGGDYSEDQSSTRFPIEGHEVLAAGGTVRIVPHQAGHSTSEIVRRIQSLELEHEVADD